MRRQWVLHPFLIAVFPILALFAHNVYETPPREIVQPIWIMLAVTMVTWLALKGLLGDGRCGGLHRVAAADPLFHGRVGSPRGEPDSDYFERIVGKPGIQTRAGQCDLARDPDLCVSRGTAAAASQGSQTADVVSQFSRRGPGAAPYEPGRVRARVGPCRPCEVKADPLHGSAAAPAAPRRSISSSSTAMLAPTSSKRTSASTTPHSSSTSRTKAFTSPAGALPTIARLASRSLRCSTPAISITTSGPWDTTSP